MGLQRRSRGRPKLTDRHGDAAASKGPDKKRRRGLRRGAQEDEIVEDAVVEGYGAVQVYGQDDEHPHPGLEEHYCHGQDSAGAGYFPYEGNDPLPFFGSRVGGSLCFPFQSDMLSSVLGGSDFPFEMGQQRSQGQPSLCGDPRLVCYGAPLTYICFF